MTDIAIPQVSLEFVDAATADAVQGQLNDDSAITPLVSVISAVTAVLPEMYRNTTRVVFTGNFTKSVQSRSQEQSREFSTRRGSGFVAGKTMGKNKDGVVEILFPSAYLMEQSREALDVFSHLGAHEAVHAAIHHQGKQLFDLDKRGKFDEAMLRFVAMAGGQAEEHVAECIANRYQAVPWKTTSTMLQDAFDAWDATIKELSVMPNDTPDYFYQGMTTSLGAFDVLWKVLAYLAAELREAEAFKPVPDEIRRLTSWQQDVEPWWNRYVDVLADIPVDLSVDVQKNDEVIKKMALLLQEWAKSIGIDYHDTNEGPWFQASRLNRYTMLL